MPPRLPYLLDTSILVVLVRGGKLGRYMEDQYHLSAHPSRPLISIISVGEALKAAKEFGWGENKINTLWELLGNFVWVGNQRREILESYAEIAHYCEGQMKPAKTKPQNDYWIAATAKVTGATLLTTDKHFDDLHGKFIDRIWIDEALGKQ